MEVSETISTIENAIRRFGRGLAGSYPSISPLLVTAWGLYVDAYARTVARKHALLHARRTEIGPYDLVRVDPDRVEYLVEESALPAQARDRNVFSKSKFKYAGAVLDGDWDETERRFDDTPFFRSFEAHFDRGVDWEETAFFDTILEHIDRGVTLWGCTTRRDLEERCEDLDRLYEAIERHGYRAQAELADASFEDPIDRDATPEVVRFVNHEVTVCVGRDGRLLFKDGRNRLAIAKVLGLDSIPVWIMVRHAGWQRFREAVAAGAPPREDLPERLRTHPDLATLGRAADDR